MSKVKILSCQDITQRYPESSTSSTTILAREAVRNNYQIALIEASSFEHGNGDIIAVAESILKERFSYDIQLRSCIEVGELISNKLYIAFIPRERIPLGENHSTI